MTRQNVKQPTDNTYTHNSVTVYMNFIRVKTIYNTVFVKCFQYFALQICMIQIIQPTRCKGFTSLLLCGQWTNTWSNDTTNSALAYRELCTVFSD